MRSRSYVAAWTTLMTVSESLMDATARGAPQADMNRPGVFLGKMYPKKNTGNDTKPPSGFFCRTKKPKWKSSLLRPTNFSKLSSRIE
jgi:hypothetical protein